MRIPILLAAFALSTAVAGTPSKVTMSTTDIVSGTGILNREAIKLLGVDLKSVGLLLELAQENPTYFERNSLGHYGRQAASDALEKAGFISVEIIHGLPDGTQATQEFVKIRVTEKGGAVIDSLREREISNKGP